MRKKKADLWLWEKLLQQRYQPYYSVYPWMIDYVTNYSQRFSGAFELSEEEKRLLDIEQENVELKKELEEIRLKKGLEEFRFFNS